MAQAAHLHRWIEETIVGYQLQGFGRWAVVDKSRDRIVGSCGFGCVEPGRQIDLSFLLAPDCWGRGLATEAAGACLRFGFERLNFVEVTARVALEHAASRRVLAKAGFVYQGLRVDGRDEGADALYVVRNPYAAAL